MGIHYLLVVAGRVFEGTHEDMFQSIQKLKDLPPETKVYCAHEYTESNLEFALEVDASNHDLKKRVADLSKKMTANNELFDSIRSRT